MIKIKEAWVSICATPNGPAERMWLNADRVYPVWQGHTLLLVAPTPTWAHHLTRHIALLTARFRTQGITATVRVMSGISEVPPRVTVSPERMRSLAAVLRSELGTGVDAPRHALDCNARVLRRIAQLIDVLAGGDSVSVNGALELVQSATYEHCGRFAAGELAVAS